MAFAAEIGKNKEAEKSGAKDNKKVEPADKSKRGLDHHLGYELSHGLLGLEESHHLDDKLGHIDIKHGHIDVKHGHIDLKHSDIGYHDDGHDHGHISTITIEKHVPVPYPVKIIVEKKIPVIKEKLVPIPVKVPVHIEKKVPYPVHVPVPVKVSAFKVIEINSIVENDTNAASDGEKKNGLWSIMTLFYSREC